MLARVSWGHLIWRGLHSAAANNEQMDGLGGIPPIERSEKWNPLKVVKYCVATSVALS